MPRVNGIEPLGVGPISGGKAKHTEEAPNGALRLSEQRELVDRPQQNRWRQFVNVLIDNQERQRRRRFVPTVPVTSSVEAQVSEHPTKSRKAPQPGSLGVLAKRTFRKLVPSLQRANVVVAVTQIEFAACG